MFDFLVVAIALVPASGPLAVLRALRVLRVLRLITLVPSMKRVVGGLLAALPGLGSVSMIIGIIFYVAAVIATQLFALQFPALFGDLGRTAFTLFQVMTLEGWAMEVVRPVMAVYPWAWVFFFVFILCSTFTLLNLFIAVIVNAIQQENSTDGTPLTQTELAELKVEIAALRQQLQSVNSPASSGRQDLGQPRTVKRRLTHAIRAIESISWQARGSGSLAWHGDRNDPAHRCQADLPRQHLSASAVG